MNFKLYRLDINPIINEYKTYVEEELKTSNTSQRILLRRIRYMLEDNNFTKHNYNDIIEQEKEKFLLDNTFTLIKNKSFYLGLLYSLKHAIEYEISKYKQFIGLFRKVKEDKIQIYSVFETSHGEVQIKTVTYQLDSDGFYHHIETKVYTI